MEPVRVTLGLSWIVPAPWYEQEFDHKTGTVVWATRSAWGEYQCDVELDEPHSRFGKFCKTCYTPSRRRNTVVVHGDLDKIQHLARAMDGNFAHYHDKHGDPLPWVVVKELLEKEIE